MVLNIPMETYFVAYASPKMLFLRDPAQEAPERSDEGQNSRLLPLATTGWCGRLHGSECNSPLPCFPSNLSNPSRPLRHILSFHQQLHAVKLLSQFLVGCDFMHERMASSAKPRHLRQLPFSVPATFDRLRVHLSRDKMVVSQRKLFAVTNLAPVGPGSSQ